MLVAGISDPSSQRLILESVEQLGGANIRIEGLRIAVTILWTEVGLPRRMKVQLYVIPEVLD